LDLAEPKSWGTFNEWAIRYCDAKPGRFGGLDTTGQSNLEELTVRLAQVTHKIDYRETHRHLPAKRRQSVYIAPEDQCRPSAGFAKQLKAAAKRGGTALLEVRLAQAASSKRRAILEMVNDHISSGHKVVIFSGRRKDVEDIGDRIKKLDVVKKSKGKIQVWAAHGGNDASERQEIVDKYMKSTNACVLVGTGNSFGESLNMQDTDAAFFVMLPYTPGELRQWEGRFCRLGQKRPVTIYYVIAEGTVDEHVADILISKLPAVQKIAEDEELAEAQDVIAGMDDPEEIADSILAKL
jgi:SNF2 family DNA or RNA helicase